LLCLARMGAPERACFRPRSIETWTSRRVVRSASKQPDIRHEKLTVMVGDPCDASFLKRAFRGQDTVISTLGGRRPTRSATSVYFRSADAIVDAAWDTGLKRVLVTSTALLFPRRRLMDGILRSLVPNVVRSATRMEGILESVCPRLDVRKVRFPERWRRSSVPRRKGGIAGPGHVGFAVRTGTLPRRCHREPRCGSCRLWRVKRDGLGRPESQSHA
jgi:hypothetical protein